MPKCNCLVEEIVPHHPKPPHSVENLSPHHQPPHAVEEPVLHKNGESHHPLILFMIMRSTMLNSQTSLSIGPPCTLSPHGGFLLHHRPTLGLMISLQACTTTITIISTQENNGLLLLLHCF